MSGQAKVEQKHTEEAAYLVNTLMGLDDDTEVLTVIAQALADVCENGRLDELRRLQSVVQTAVRGLASVQQYLDMRFAFLMEKP